MTVTADGRHCRLIYIGEPEKTASPRSTWPCPKACAPVLVPVEIIWLGQPVAEPAWVRIMPAGPAVPRVTTVADGINLLSGTRIVTGTVKVTMHEVADASQFGATIEGQNVLDIESFCARTPSRSA